MPIRRQLAPTVGPKASDVTFQTGILGGIVKSIAVGRTVNIDGNVYINCDSTFMPANDYIVGCGIVPVGDIDIFIAYSPEAYRMQRILSPTPLPESANNFDGSESASLAESTGSDLNFCYVAGVGSDSQPQSDDPESILPALQEDAT